MERPRKCEVEHERIFVKRKDRNMKWEYKKYDGMLLEPLQELGKEGWEVACFISNSSGYLLKRKYTVSAMIKDVWQLHIKGEAI